MNDEDEDVILVDSDDQEIGLFPKLAAHRKGLLHRAISVFIFNLQGQMLLQQRARHKYHSGGLWTNTCCTHPRQGEGVKPAAERRLREELGIDCFLHWVARTRYEAPVGNGLTENELVHLFRGHHDGGVLPNPQEVEAYEWTDHRRLIQKIEASPNDFTYWFKYYMSEYGEIIFTDNGR